MLIDYLTRTGVGAGRIVKKVRIEAPHPAVANCPVAAVGIVEVTPTIPTSSLEKISELSALQKPVRELDVTILHQYLLPHIFKVESGKEYDADKILYIKDADDALNQVAEGKASAAFILNPTKIKQVEAISEIGERMPQKSTFFYPKLLSGLLFNRIK